MPKKNSKLAEGKLGLNPSIVLPVDKDAELCPKTQLALLAEILLANQQRLVDIIDKDFAASATLALSKKGELPTITNVLQVAGCMARFYKQLEAVVVDEFKELMDSVDREVAHIAATAPSVSKPLPEVHEQDWPELLRSENLRFLNDASMGSASQLPEHQPDASEDDALPKLIDDELLCFIKWDVFQEEVALPQAEQREIAPRRSQPASDPNADRTNDYSYYQFIVQKAGKDHAKDEREDFETSTKSGGQHEETEIAPVEPIPENLNENDPEDQFADQAAPDPDTDNPKPQTQSKSKSKKRKKNLTKPKPSVEIKKPDSVSEEKEDDEEEASLELPQSQKPTARKNDKEQEKIKQSFNEQFDEMLVRADEVENLDEYERCCVQIINAHELITKKMKQKKRKALRMRIDRIKELRQNEITEQDFSDQYEDQYVDEEDSDYENSPKPSRQTKQEEEFLRNLLNGRDFYYRGQFPDVNFDSLLSDRRINRPIQLTQQSGRNRAQKQGQGSKWKERLTESIRQRQEKMSEYRHKLDKAYQMSRLFSAHRDNRVTPLLSILHEGGVCLDEPVHVERRKKETRVVFWLPNNSYLADNDFH